MAPTASILPVNSVTQFWKELVFFDTMYSCQIDVCCCLSPCPPSTCWHLFILLIPDFFFWDWNSTGFKFPPFPLFKLGTPFTLSQSSEISSVFHEFKPATNSFEITSESSLNILGCGTSVAETMDIKYFPTCGFPFTVGNYTCFSLGINCASHPLLMDFSLVKIDAKRSCNT